MRTVYRVRVIPSDQYRKRMIVTYNEYGVTDDPSKYLSGFRLEDEVTSTVHVEGQPFEFIHFTDGGNMAQGGVGWGFGADIKTDKQ